MNLQWVHGRDVMDYDADLAAVLGQPGLPLGIRQAAGKRGERTGALFEPLGQGFGPLSGRHRRHRGGL